MKLTPEEIDEAIAALDYPVTYFFNGMGFDPKDTLRRFADDTQSRVAEKLVPKPALPKSVLNVMDDDEHFIAYCDIHCKTERALFSGAQINRMRALALMSRIPVPDGVWIAMHSTMQQLVDKARKHRAPK